MSWFSDGNYLICQWMLPKKECTLLEWDENPFLVFEQFIEETLVVNLAVIRFAARSWPTDKNISPLCQGNR